MGLGDPLRFPLDQEYGFMLYKLGRFLQVIGLVLLPVGIAGNLARPREFSLWYSLAVAGVGVACFILGYLLQQLVRKE